MSQDHQQRLESIYTSSVSYLPPHPGPLPPAAGESSSGGDQPDEEMKKSGAGSLFSLIERRAIQGVVKEFIGSTIPEHKVRDVAIFIEGGEGNLTFEKLRTKTPKKVKDDDIKSIINAVGELRRKRHVNDLFSPLIGMNEQAFKSPFLVHEGVNVFLGHVEEQRKKFSEAPHGVRYVPYFPVLQSSGYGKSRLVDHLRKTEYGYTIAYWSFGSAQTFPRRNVDILMPTSVNRVVLTNAFKHAISSVLEICASGGDLPDTHVVSVPKDNKIAVASPSVQFPKGKKVIFVMDEAAFLASDFVADGVSYFRCLRAAMNAFSKYCRINLFFVVMSTFSTMVDVPPFPLPSPSSRLTMVPSNWPRTDVENADLLIPLDPFILCESLTEFNKRTEILNTSVEICHRPDVLFAMGRPLWKSYIGQMDINSLLQWAGSKLIMQRPTRTKILRWESKQLLVILAARLCLVISPQSHFAPTLVASHLATVLSVSADRYSMQVCYPSEPILAVASRQFMADEEDITELIAAMTGLVASGAVSKGHRAEVIVRLLSLLAIDKAMLASSTNGSAISEVQLGEFLVQFDREQAPVSLDHMISEESFADLDGLDGDVLLNGAKDHYWDPSLQSATVCFTHFVFLSKEAPDLKITPNLLKYAYRRTAAIVLEGGRKGIDWIIPLRVRNAKEAKPSAKTKGKSVKLDDENDIYIGLIGQDKNRISDTSATLVKADNEETHLKVNAQYFLTKEEQATFTHGEMEMSWPSLLFAVGVDEVSSHPAKRLERRVLRSGTGGENETCPYPCIVLTGLDYANLMSNDADTKLKEFRDFEIGIPQKCKESIPIMYGLL